MKHNLMDAKDLLCKMIDYETITPNECGIYKLLLSVLDSTSLNKAYKTHILEQENHNVKNLFFMLLPESASMNSLDSLTHICFAGHVDVVPPGEGWECNPFKSSIKDGYIYGRGAQDMKGGIAAFMCAIRDFLNDAKSNIAISILLTSDEEGDGIYGTKIMLDSLKEQNLLPDFAIIAEPTSIHKTGDMIKHGRRGSINGTLHIQGKQGHVAYPQKCINPIELLGSKLGQLAGVNLDNGNSDFDSSKLVITDIRSGMEVVNVTPNDLKIMFNVRNSPLSNKDTITKYIADIMQEVPYTLNLTQSAKPFITDTNNEHIILLQEAIRLKGIDSTLSTSGGTSDARFFGEFGVPCVELGVPNDRIHAINERVKCEDLQMLYEIFLAFLHNANKEKK